MHPHLCPAETGTEISGFAFWIPIKFSIVTAYGMKRLSLVIPQTDDSI